MYRFLHGDQNMSTQGQGFWILPCGDILSPYSFTRATHTHTHTHTHTLRKNTIDILYI